jgi:hypothetical protein
MTKKLVFFCFLFSVFCFLFSGGVNAASLSLSPASASKNIGDIFDVDIVLDTAGEAVAGATAILTYDTAKLQVTTGTQITAGTIFNQSPLTNTVSSGQIRYDSGSLGTSYNGRGTMAKIQFKAIAAGSAAVNFVFNTTTTIDTSLVAAASGPTNVLTTVYNGVYTIGGVTTPPPGGQILTTGSGAPGTLENTLVALAGGILLLGAGLILKLRFLF